MELKYSENDLFETYVKVFIRRNIIGGLKGFNFPIYETSEWIIHARYLLTEVKDEHIKALFNAKNSYYSKYFHITASWIAALLKKEEYIQYIEESSIQNGDHYWSAAFYASMLLFDNEKVINYYLHELQKQQTPNPSNNINSRALIIHSLRLYDIKFNTDYSSQHKEFKVSKREENLINVILKFSDILKCGIKFSDEAQLKSGIKTILNKTVPPIHHGILNHRPISLISDEDVESHKKQIQTEYKQACSKGIKYSLNLRKTLHNVSNKHEHFELTKCIKQFLLDTSTKKLSENIKIAARKTLNYKDILSAIELDFYYELPGDIIIVLFEKLNLLINPSYQFYEQYAIHLLLRGTENDKKAIFLFDQAQKIKNEVMWIEDGSVRYTMVKENVQTS